MGVARVRTGGRSGDSSKRRVSFRRLAIALGSRVAAGYGAPRQDHSQCDAQVRRHCGAHGRDEPARPKSPRLLAVALYNGGGPGSGARGRTAVGCLLATARSGHLWRPHCCLHNYSFPPIHRLAKGLLIGQAPATWLTQPTGGIIPLEAYEWAWANHVTQPSQPEIPWQGCRGHPENCRGLLVGGGQLGTRRAAATWHRREKLA